MTKKKPRSSKTKASRQPAISEKNVRLMSYEVTDEPIKNDKYNPMPKAVLNRLQQLRDMLRVNPQVAIDELLFLKEKHPKVPILYNYLAAAYDSMGDRGASREIAKENYQQNPKYLFAKINYAQMCIFDGNIDEIPDIFENKFDIKMLYPERTKFHVAECCGFAGVMCAYHCMIDKRETAELYHKMLVQLDPDSSMVKFAESFLYPSFMQSLARRFVKKEEPKPAAKLGTTDDEPEKPAQGDFEA